MASPLQLLALVNWEGIPALLDAGDAAHLVEAALDSIDEPSNALCGNGANPCAAGLFALRLLGIYSLLLQKSIAHETAAAIVEPLARAFGSDFWADLQSRRTLHDDFGENRKEPLSVFQCALQVLGRLLHKLAQLPQAAGPAPGFSEFEHDASSCNRQGQFEFGKNWQQFVEKKRISVEAVLSAVWEARNAFAVAASGLYKLTALDLGCGSGLQSLALYLLGAQVTSVDVQDAAVETTLRLRDAFTSTEAGTSSMDASWTVAKGSAMQAHHLSLLGPFDIVYTWGVLHHTGDLWQALHNAQLPLKEDGLLLVAIYAAEFYDEKENLMKMKRAYRAAGTKKKENLEIVLGLHWLRPLLAAGKGPFEVMRNFTVQRGMDFWTDVRDWLGGWPMEFASAVEVLSFARRSGLSCVGVRRYGGNTEFALTRPSGIAKWTSGRVCEKLGEFVEDLDARLEQVQLSFYFRPNAAKPIRRWWKHPLPKNFVAKSDKQSDPQRDLLLLLGADLEPFGYPSAQHARPDALADPSLAFFAFWDGVVYASPVGGTVDGGSAISGGVLIGLSVCLQPSSEWTSAAEHEIRAKAAHGLARL